jgi:hypothetical protein
VRLPDITLPFLDEFRDEVLSAYTELEKEFLAQGFREFCPERVDQLPFINWTSSQQPSSGKALADCPGAWPEDHQLAGLALRRPALMKLLLDNFASLAADLLGEPASFYTDAGFFKDGRSGGFAGAEETPWHRDLWFVPARTNHFVTFWCPLFSTPAPLRFLRGTHRDLASSHWGLEPASGATVDVSWPGTLFPAGSCTAHHGELLLSFSFNFVRLALTFSGWSGAGRVPSRPWFLLFGQLRTDSRRPNRPKRRTSPTRPQCVCVVVSRSCSWTASAPCYCGCGGLRVSDLCRLSGLSLVLDPEAYIWAPGRSKITGAL